ncbi:MAG: hypothetical protein COB66_00645 [Coxiella sp. (in: Bacteria)]|nr:MAG: hypothetical protein COB66_00645 [Coxiella sp. (in: g-proteobacteria)]
MRFSYRVTIGATLMLIVPMGWAQSFGNKLTHRISPVVIDRSAVAKSENPGIFRFQYKDDLKSVIYDKKKNRHRLLCLFDGTLPPTKRSTVQLGNHFYFIKDFTLYAPALNKFKTQKSNAPVSIVYSLQDENNPQKVDKLEVFMTVSKQRNFVNPIVQLLLDVAVTLKKTTSDQEKQQELLDQKVKLFKGAVVMLKKYHVAHNTEKESQFFLAQLVPRKAGVYKYPGSTIWSRYKDQDVFYRQNWYVAASSVTIGYKEHMDLLKLIGKDKDPARKYFPLKKPKPGKVRYY